MPGTPGHVKLGTPLSPGNKYVISLNLGLWNASMRTCLYARVAVTVATVA